METSWCYKQMLRPPETPSCWFRILTKLRQVLLILPVEEMELEVNHTCGPGMLRRPSTVFSLQGLSSKTNPYFLKLKPLMGSIFIGGNFSIVPARKMRLFFLLLFNKHSYLLCPLIPGNFKLIQTSSLKLHILHIFTLLLPS